MEMEIKKYPTAEGPEMVSVDNVQMYEPGTEVFWFDEDGNDCHGVVERIVTENVPSSMVQLENTGMVLLRRCWPSKSELFRAEAQRAKLQKQAYKDFIKDKDDLVMFLLTHVAALGDHDEDVEAAAIERAHELGIET